MRIQLKNHTSSKEITIPKVASLVVLEGAQDYQLQLKGDDGNAQTIVLDRAERWGMWMEPDRTMGQVVVAAPTTLPVPPRRRGRPRKVVVS